MSLRSLRFALGCAVAGLLLLAGVQVTARSAEDTFAGKVLLLKKRPPSYFKTKGGFVSFLRGNSMTTVYENADRQWKFETMSFFRKPLGDYEVEMVFFDIENGTSKSKRRFVDSYPQYTQDRNTRVLSGKTELVRPQFDADRKYMIIVQHKGKELAEGRFSTRGTSQAQLDQQKRVEHMQKEMEESMKELERKAKEQEEASKREEQNKQAAEDLF